MAQTMKTIGTLFLILLWSSFSAYATVYNSDGSAADVIAKHALASDGDTITIPAGSFTWLVEVTISKGIKLQGAGSGRIIGRSASVATIGTGAKTFTTQSGLDISNGQTLRIAQLGSRANYMEGTVTSYSDTTLVMDITSTGGSGSKKVWWIATVPTTTVTHNTAASPSLNLIESTAASIEVSGIQFEVAGGVNPEAIKLSVNSGGNPILMHDCWFQIPSSNCNMIYAPTHRGVVWNCSFDAQWTNQNQSSLALDFENASDSTGSHTSNSTMGTDDTDGTNNFYVEDCDFHAFLNALDFSSGSRTVVRHCLFNNAGMGSHGPDSQDFGNRHFEVYDNQFVFNGFNDGTTLNLNWWLFLRGGTGVWTDNNMQAITSQDYGTRATYEFYLLALRQQSEMRPQWACWSGGYPLTHQIGWGWANGDNASEPLYIWNNTGTASQAPSFANTSCGAPEACPDCATQPTTQDFVQLGRDYFLTPKPGYTKYTYPHPLHGDSVGPEAPGNLRILP